MWIPASTTKGTACLWAANATIFNPTGAITPPLAITAWAPTITYNIDFQIRNEKHKGINSKINSQDTVIAYHIYTGNHGKYCRISNYCSLKPPCNQLFCKGMTLISDFNTAIIKKTSHKKERKILETLKPRRCSLPFDKASNLLSPWSTLCNKDTKWSFFLLCST